MNVDDESATFMPVERQRLVGLSRATWRAARLPGLDGGPSAVQLLTAALARYVDDDLFRRRVDGRDLEQNLPRRNVRIPDELWANVVALAGEAGRGVYGTADAALAAHLEDQG